MPLVYHVITDKNVGGAGRVLLSLLGAPSARGIASHVLLPRGSALCPLLFREHIPYTELGEVRGTSLSFFSVPSFFRIFKRARPDAIVSHASLSARIAGRLAGVPLLLSFKHCALPIRAPRLYSAWTDATVATSENAKRVLRACGIPEDKILLLENGAERFTPEGEEARRRARTALGVSAGEIAVGMSARLSPVKGHATAIYALAAVKDQLPLSLWLLGDGEEKARLMQLCAQLGVSSRVHFLGYREERADFYAAMDAHLSCSLASETASLSLAEGMSAGCVTLASAIEGNLLRVQDGGVFFPPGDASALSRLLLRLADPLFVRKARKAAQSRASLLPSVTEMRERFEEILLSLLKNRLHF